MIPNNFIDTLFLNIYSQKLHTYVLLFSYRFLLDFSFLPRENMYALSIKGYTKIKQTSKIKQTTHLCVCTQATAFISPLLEFKHVHFFDVALNESEKGPKSLPYLVISFSFFSHFFLESTNSPVSQLANSICFPFVCIFHRQSSSARLHAQNVWIRCTIITENSVTYRACRLSMKKQTNQPN